MKSDSYLYIYLHIPRTAGTTFINHIEKKYKKDELLRLYREELKLNEKKKYEYKDYKNEIEKYISKLSSSKKDKIKVIYGHRVPYGIHRYFKKKPFYFTFVRDPLKRIISAYNLWSNSYNNSSSKERKSRLFKNGYLVKGKKPSFEIWLNAKIKQDNIDTMGITLERFLDKLGYINKSETDLNKFHFIGITENFDENSLYLYKLLNIKKFFINKNVSGKSLGVDSLKLSKGALKVIKKDYKIYKTALKHNELYKNKHKEFRKFVNSMKFQRFILLPFTQFIYEPRQTLRLLLKK